MKKRKAVAGLLLAVVLAGAGILMYLWSRGFARSYTDENGIYKCSRRIRVKQYEFIGNGISKSKGQKPVNQSDADAYCTLEAAF